MHAKQQKKPPTLTIILVKPVLGLETEDAEVTHKRIADAGKGLSRGCVSMWFLDQYIEKRLTSVCPKRANPPGAAFIGTLFNIPMRLTPSMNSYHTNIQYDDKNRMGRRTWFAK